MIHLAGDDNDGLNANVTSGSCFTICGRSFEKAFVKVDDFWKVAADCKAYRNNKKDKKQRFEKKNFFVQLEYFLVRPQKDFYHATQCLNSIKYWCCIISSLA